MNDSEKLLAFIEWCKKKEMEEVIVRLSRRPNRLGRTFFSILQLQRHRQVSKKASLENL